MEKILKLTFTNRVKLCWEILTTTSGHKHSSSEKQLSSFLKGYQYGLKDKQLEYCVDCKVYQDKNK